MTAGMIMRPGIMPGNHGNDSFTTLLLHMDGMDKSTSFIDSSPAANTDGMSFGPAALTTSAARFGPSCGSFLASLNCGIRFPDSPGWSFGTGDFTFDFWLNVPALGALNVIAAAYENVATGIGWVIFLDASNNLTIQMLNTSFVLIGKYFAAVGAMGTNTWNHLAIVMQGGAIAMYLNGVSLSVTIDTNLGGATIPDSGTPMHIGTTGSGCNFLLDEFRISKGIARWTSGFTPPGRAWG